MLKIQTIVLKKFSAKKIKIIVLKIKKTSLTNPKYFCVKIVFKNVLKIQTIVLKNF